MTTSIVVFISGMKKEGINQICNFIKTKVKTKKKMIKKRGKTKIITWQKNNI